MGTSVGQVGQHQQGHVMHVHEQSRLYDSMKWQAEASAVFHRHVPSPVQAIAVLQEIESSTPGNKIQIVYERQADITPEALAELIEQACLLHLAPFFVHLLTLTTFAVSCANSGPQRGTCGFCADMNSSVPTNTVWYEQVGWPKRKLTKLETALKGSYLVSAMLKRELRADATIASEQLIGLIRCTSDRVFNATIWDVLVSPEFQVDKAAALLS